MFYLYQTHRAAWEGLPQTFKMLKVIQAQEIPIFPLGIDARTAQSGMNPCGAVALWAGEVQGSGPAVPHSGCCDSRSGVQNSVPETQDAERLQKISVLTSDRRIMAFPGGLDDVSFSANKVKSAKRKKKNN